MNEKYAVSIMLTGAADREVRKIKADVKSIVGNYPGSSADPQITLFDYEAGEVKQTVFDRTIQAVCITINPFEIRYKGFDEFYWNKTIYVALEEISYKTIIQVRKKFSAELKHGKYDEEVNFDSGKSPHITICRTMQEEQFITAKKYFHNKKFEGSFLCDSLSLRILRKTASYTRYDVVKNYPFAKQSLTLF